MRKLRRLFREAILHLRAAHRLQLAIFLETAAEYAPNRKKRELWYRMSELAYVEAHVLLLRTAGI